MKNLFDFKMVSPKIEIINDKKDVNHKTFIIDPLENGYGTTIGNSIRRVALASMPGGAITEINIKGVAHEFSTMDDVVEDVTSIVLNVKNIIIEVDTDDIIELKLQSQVKGAITAGDIVVPPNVRILNPELVIATLAKDKVKFDMKLFAKRGVGYNVAEENRGDVKTSGKIFVDSIFTPVQKITYKTEDTRVGEITNYDKLIMDI